VDPGGSDNNDGSAESPWLTLQFAVENVDPGDTILVRSGTYGGFRIGNSGTDGAWITIKAAPGANALINRPGPNNVHDSNVEIENYASAVSYWVVEGFEVASAPRAGIDIRGNSSNHVHHIVIRGNKVHGTGRTTGIFTAFTDHVIIENNESYSNSEHGIYCSNSGDFPTVRYNKVYQNRVCGIQFNADAGMGGDGIISGGIIDGNIIYDNCDRGGAAINLDGVTNTIVRNNLLYNNHASGIALFRNNGATYSQNNRVLNNTIIQPEDGRWGILITQSGCINNKLFNNIIYNYHSWKGSITIPSSGVTGFESDYNIVMNRLSASGTESSISLSEWQALGYDVHSFIAPLDSIFINTSGNDYHLRATSPAIDAGTTLPDVEMDLERHARPAGGAFDIGAYEKSDSTISPPRHVKIH
jgi:parallel beta-helix repeat protein